MLNSTSIHRLFIKAAYKCVINIYDNNIYFLVSVLGISAGLNFTLLKSNFVQIPVLFVIPFTIRLLQSIQRIIELSNTITEFSVNRQFLLRHPFAHHRLIQCVNKRLRHPSDKGAMVQ